VKNVANCLMYFGVNVLIRRFVFPRRYNAAMYTEYCDNIPAFPCYSAAHTARCVAKYLLLFVQDEPSFLHYRTVNTNLEKENQTHLCFYMQTTFLPYIFFKFTECAFILSCLLNINSISPPLTYRCKFIDFSEMFP
jgi:hypothetical protein